VKLSEADFLRFKESYDAGTTIEKMAVEFGISRWAVERLLRQNAMVNRRIRRPRPVDIYEVWEKLGYIGARQHYGAGSKTFTRWMKEARIDGRSRDHDNRIFQDPEIPADWALIAPTMYKGELRQHYKISRRAVERLVELTGVRSRKTNQEIAAERVVAPVKEKKVTGWHNPHWQTNGMTNAHHVYDSAPGARAASFLRKIYAPVHRADLQMYDGKDTTWGDLHGVPNGGRGYYVVGGLGVLSQDELIAHAVKRGHA